jgi:hypothetical protein
MAHFVRRTLAALLPVLAALASAHPHHDEPHLHPHSFLGLPVWVWAVGGLALGIGAVVFATRRLAARRRAAAQALREGGAEAAPR